MRGPWPRYRRYDLQTDSPNKLPRYQLGMHRYDLQDPAIGSEHATHQSDRLKAGWAQMREFNLNAPLPDQLLVTAVQPQRLDR